MSELDQPKQISEAEEATNVKATMQRQLADLCATMDHAARLGFVVNFSLGIGPNGRYSTQSLTVAKHF